MDLLNLSGQRASSIAALIQTAPSLLKPLRIVFSRISRQRNEETRTRFWQELRATVFAAVSRVAGAVRAGCVVPIPVQRFRSLSSSLSTAKGVSGQAIC